MGFEITYKKKKRISNVFGIGGLSTSIAPLLSNLLLSAAVAITGILFPMSFSFLLIPMVPGTTPLQAFAAGAALSVTSLGTIFSMLSSFKFTQTRLGTVLISAAMMDDVVGLVLIRVIAELGAGGVSGEAVGRPVGASMGLLVFVVLSCRWVVGPVYRRFSSVTEGDDGGNLGKAISWIDMSGGHKAFLAHSGILLALVASASYAGASALFAAYLAGAAVSWWDKMAFPCQTFTVETPASCLASIQEPSLGAESVQDEDLWTGVRVYEHYYAPPARRVLVPLFFASIGFSIPITQLFGGTTVWRGLIYALLMTLGKFMTGLWLLRFSTPQFIARPLVWLRSRTLRRSSITAPVSPPPELRTSEQANTTPAPDQDHTPNPEQPPQKPRSLYPPAILGLAMVARGEIGFLIASIAEAHGIFNSPSSHSLEHGKRGSELYLILIWAIALCTVLGPVAVGLSVERVKVLEMERIDGGGAVDTGVLGVWGVKEGNE